ncbi:MAG TPA: hypothetical protein VFY40_11165 [Blastocatellia bacterium]|nr:hypothetical protein [Blastocatellia bacterium]
MRIMKIKRVIALAVLLAAAGLTAPGYVKGYGAGQPSNEEVAFAQRTSDLLLNELFAALVQEFNETTPENVEEGKQAISLVFHDSNRDIRLVGFYPPLLGGFNNLPSDLFEQRSLVKALKGDPNTSVERVGNRWYYRRSIPLSNTIHQACVLCHTNFTPEFFQQTNNPKQMVGALMLRTPIKNED